MTRQARWPRTYDAMSIPRAVSRSRLVGRVAGSIYTISSWTTVPGCRMKKLTALFRRLADNGSEALVRGSVGLGLYVAREIAERMGTTRVVIRKGLATGGW